MNGELYITGLCPYCSLKLDYLPEEKAVACTGCGAVLPTSALVLISKEQDLADAVADKTKAIFESINSPETALIHFDNFVDKYDWASFAETSSFTIPALDAYADAALMKFPADHLSYILDFKRRALPILKKIETLNLLVVELSHKTRDGDPAEVHEVFDIYSSITKAVCECRESVKNELVKDINLAKKFGASDDELEDLIKGAELFRELTGSIVPINDITEIPEYKKIKLTKDAQHIAELRASGLDPEKTYDKALKLLESGDLNNALRLLTAISPYSDSEQIIEKHTSVYRFGNGLYEMAGRIFLRKPEIVRTRGGRYRNNGFYSLYEVKDGVVSETPSVTGVSDILATFGTRIFFIRRGRSVCCYDTSATELYANVRVLDESNEYGYAVEGKFRIIMSKDRSCFYIRKKLNPLSKGGLFKRAPSYNRNNNYSLIKISMDTVDSRIGLPLIVDVMDSFEDTVFYTVISEGMNYPIFRMYNLKTGASKTILGPDCVINQVNSSKIIYTVWAPNQYNMNLFTLDYETGERQLLAKNIRKYHAFIDGKIFYSVGGEHSNRLYAIDIDGEGRTEIMSNAGRVIFVRAGWIYYKSGEGRNACLKKIGLDGQNKTVIADRFDRALKLENGLIYYVGRGNSLCAARCDGGGVSPIARDIHTDEIILDADCIYYLKKDMDLEDRPVYSLYSASLDGKNLNKLVYDVTAIKEHNEEELYIYRSEDKQFMISTPVNKKEIQRDYITATVCDYCRVNKQTGDITLIARVGAPDISYVPVHGRFLFFKKTKYLPTTVTPIERMSSRYERENVATAGEVYREAQAIAARKRANKKNKKKAD